MSNVIAAPRPQKKRADHRLFITFSVMLATIMQALDTTIANVALPHMQGAMGATQDQTSWVLTSYIVAAAITMPLTGFVSARIGRKRLFVWSVIGFTLASMLCGAAQSIEQIVIFRLIKESLAQAWYHCHNRSCLMRGQKKNMVRPWPCGVWESWLAQFLAPRWVVG